MNLKVRTRLVLITFLPLIFLAGVMMIMAQMALSGITKASRDSIYEKFQGVSANYLVNNVKVLKSALSSYYDSDMEIEEAKDNATKLLNSIKFGELGNSFAFDYEGVNRGFGGRPELNGKQMTDLLDLNGRSVTRQVIQAGKDGKDYVTIEYKHQKTGNIVRKIEAVINLPKWQWVVGFEMDAEIIKNIAYKNYENSIAAGDAWFLQLTIVILSLFVLTFVFIYWYAKRTLSPLNKIVLAMQDLARGEADLTKSFNITSNDEFGKLSKAFNDFMLGIKSLVLEVKSTTEQVIESSETANSGSYQMISDLAKQQTGVDSIAESMEQMVVSVSQVAKNAQFAAATAKNGSQDVASTSKKVQDFIRVINAQADMIYKASIDIGQLQEAGQQIGEVMNVINAIAEQTNLLALNAAIEAARAGEAGRGFAVVADEVRSLAGRTHESTTQIQSTIERLHKSIENAVEAMESSSKQSQLSVSGATEAGLALEGILESINNIEKMNLEIAAATKQQSDTAEELNLNLLQIVAYSTTSAEAADKVAKNGLDLRESAGYLVKTVARFKV